MIVSYRIHTTRVVQIQLDYSIASKALELSKFNSTNTHILIQYLIHMYSGVTPKIDRKLENTNI